MTLGKIIADFETQLATQIDIGGTTATLQSATDDDGVALPAGRYFLTLDNLNSQKEHFSCTLNGTALTNLKSVSRQGVETTGAVRKHRVGASVSLTDFANLKVLADMLSGSTQLDSTSPLGYDGAPVGLTGNQLATVSYVLSVVSGGTVTFDQQVIAAQIAGEALAINDVVYFKESDQRWYKADADLTTTFDQLQLGINKTTAITGGTITVAISGPVSGFSGLTLGSKYYLSNTAGAITTTAGTYSVFIGWAVSASQILFSSDLKTNPTQKEKDALGGSLGTPSSTNKYLTQDNASIASTDQSQTTQNTAIAAGEAQATGQKAEIHQSFIPVKSKIHGVKLYKAADTGTFTGSVGIYLKLADGSGNPTTPALASVTISNADWVLLPVGEFTANFSSEYTMTQGSTYWIDIIPSTNDNANHPNFGANSAGGYSNGVLKYWNSVDSFVTLTGYDLYFKTLEGYNSQLVMTDSTGAIPLTFYDISKMPTPAFFQMVETNSGSTDAAEQLLQGAFSTTDGSVMITLANGGVMRRYARDTYTGMYKITHYASIGNYGNGTINGGTILGSYLYLFWDGGTNMSASRVNVADLTSDVAMTIPTIAVAGTNSAIVAWNDGTYLYVYNGGNSNTYKFSVSGTTLTTITSAGSVIGTTYYQVGAMQDGTYTYVLGVSGTTIAIQRLNDIMGAGIASTTTFQWNEYPYNSSSNPALCAGLINIDTRRAYVCKLTFWSGSGTATNMKTLLMLTPVSKS